MLTPSEKINWNYSIIHLLKGLDESDLTNYKRNNEIDWKNVDTRVSARGMQYIFLNEFGITNARCRRLMDGKEGGEDGVQLKKEIENSGRYKKLRDFCISSGMDLGYMYGEKIMIPKLAKEISKYRKADDNYNKEKIKNLIKDRRSEVVGKVVAYLNDKHNENDTVNIWFKYFKNLDSLKYVPELNRLIGELDKLTYDNLIQYRAKNSNALKNIYHKLNRAANDVAMVLQGKEKLKEIVNQFDIEENFKESGIEIK